MIYGREIIIILCFSFGFAIDEPEQQKFRLFFVE